MRSVLVRDAAYTMCLYLVPCQFSKNWFALQCQVLKHWLEVLTLGSCWFVPKVLASHLILWWNNIFHVLNEWIVDSLGAWIIDSPCALNLIRNLKTVSFFLKAMFTMNMHLCWFWEKQEINILMICLLLLFFYFTCPIHGVATLMSPLPLITAYGPGHIDHDVYQWG